MLKNKVKSLDGVSFKPKYGPAWGEQVSIDTAYSTQNPNTFVYVANYGPAIMPRVSSHRLIMRNRHGGEWRDGTCATESGSLGYVRDHLAPSCAELFNLELTEIEVNDLPRNRGGLLGIASRTIGRIYSAARDFCIDHQMKKGMWRVMQRNMALSGPSLGDPRVPQSPLGKIVPVDQVKSPRELGML